MARLLHAVLVLLLGWVAAPARAEPTNGYGAKGRSILAGDLGGFRSNARQGDGFFHEETWGAHASITVARFVVDDWALGGSAWGGVAHLDDGSHDRPSRSWAGFKLAGVYHVPLNRRLSLRFWLNAGLGFWRARDLVDRTPPEDEEEPSGVTEDRTDTAFVGDLSPEFLVHASRSLALTFGPRVSVWQPTDLNSEASYDIAFGPGVSYSFGADEVDGEALEDARRFAARGRNALSYHGTLSEAAMSTGVSLVHFVVQGLGLGGYAATSLTSSNFGDTGRVAAGLSLWGDLPLLESTSLLVTVSPGYAWNSWNDGPGDRRVTTSQELQVYAAAYLALHLHEGFLVGVGPDLSVDVRLAGDLDAPNPRYVAPGVGSRLAASF